MTTPLKDAESDRLARSPLELEEKEPEEDDIPLPSPTTKRLHADKDLERREMILNGPIGRAVLHVAIPSVATMLLQTTNGFLDRFFVGHLGAEALAAVTVSSSLMFAMMSGAMAVSVGTTALVARFIGEGDEEGARIATRQSVLLALLVSLAIGLPMYFLRYPLLRVLGMDSDALPLAARYLSITILGLPVQFVMLILNGAFRGLGDTVRPFWISMSANIVHAVFNYLLIFGALGFPKMGLPGGAVALFLSQTVAAGMYTYALKHTHLAPSLHGPWKPDWNWMKRIARIGIPASIQQFIRVGSMLAFQGLLANSPSKAAAVAALGVGLTSESIAFMPGFGYSIAASAFVGQNLGAKQSDRANAGAWVATFQAMGIMTLMGLIFWTFAGPFAHFFIQHVPGETAAQAAQGQEAIALTISYLKIALVAEPFLALGMVLTGALQGAGETVGPTRITLFTMLILRVPLAWAMMYMTPLGVVGGWWAMTLSTVAAGIATVWLFRQGRWRKVRV